LDKNTPNIRKSELKVADWFLESLYFSRLKTTSFIYLNESQRWVIRPLGGRAGRVLIDSRKVCPPFTCCFDNKIFMKDKTDWSRVRLHRRDRPASLLINSPPRRHRWEENSLYAFLRRHRWEEISLYAFLRQHRWEEISLYAFLCRHRWEEISLYFFLCQHRWEEISLYAFLRRHRWEEISLGVFFADTGERKRHYVFKLFITVHENFIFCYKLIFRPVVKKDVGYLSKSPLGGRAG
jgi:hypothetical protein